MFRIEILEKFRTHILFSVTFPPKSRRLRNNVKKHIVERGQAIDDNMAYAYCVLGN